MSRLQAAAQIAAPVVPVPVIWTVLGYQFEAGSMIVALICCFAVRIFVGLTSGAHKWLLDIPVSAIALVFTAIAVVHYRPDPFFAGIYGTGIGAAGAILITASVSWLKSKGDALSVLIGATPPDPTHAEPVAKLYAGTVQPTPPEMQAQLGKLDEPKP